MLCYVYASQHQADTYLWLKQRDGFDALPTSLRSLLGNLRFVLELNLDANRRLPHEDANVVLNHLNSQGWHLQMPVQKSVGVTSEDFQT